MLKRVYVRVIARHDEAGGITPLALTWEDGRTFEIDKVRDVKERAASKAGGHGTRYTVIILGKERYLFQECGRWFVECDDQRQGRRA